VEAYNSMLISFHTMIEDELRFGFTAHVDGIASPVGFFLGERLDRKSVGSYARIVSRCYPGFPEYLGVYIMSQLSRAGISLLNLGGSETAAIQNFKQKHAPIEERYMQMLVYGIE
jgi:hypothetical protein